MLTEQYSIVVKLVLLILLTRWFMERRKLKKLKDEEQHDQAQTDEEKNVAIGYRSMISVSWLRKINLNAVRCIVE